MMGYLSRLSRVQVIWLVGSLVAAVAVCGIGAVLEPRGRAGAPPPLTRVLHFSGSLVETIGRASMREIG